MQINARIIEYDTSMTMLKVTVEIKGQDENQVFMVSNDIVELLFEEKFSTDFHEMIYIETPDYQMITVVK